jgi:S1-C subfamily serine protease
MTKSIKIFFGICLFILQTSLAQIIEPTNEIRILESKAIMRELASPSSNTLYELPIGTQVKILGLTGGYYKVEYNGKIGYINEIFIKKTEINIVRSVPSNSSSYSNAKKWDEYNLKEHWKKNGIDKIEGIYESTGYYEDTEVPCENRYGQVICYSTWRVYATKYKLAVVKLAGKYKITYLSGNPKGAEKIAGCNCDGKSYIEPKSNQWKIGDVKANLHKTATPDLYKCDWFMDDKSLNPDGYVTFKNYSYFTVFVSGTNQDEEMFLKLYPTSDDNINQNKDKSIQYSGTGFAISSKGYIATNHHVTSGATSIKIIGVNGDFSKKYTAKFIIDDKNNDLSIIKIDDPSFTTFGTIPYVIANRTSDVGSSVFVLGYPLLATMGDEVKLTNGIVSSKSGYQSDATSYQITAPVQPGNSGGPLFNDKGNIIGIINAKHNKAENASYAIKASYLINLIDLIPESPYLQTINSLSGKSLAEQVKILKKFTYIIEVE